MAQNGHYTLFSGYSPASTLLSSCSIPHFLTTIQHRLAAVDHVHAPRFRPLPLQILRRCSISHLWAMGSHRDQYPASHPACVRRCWCASRRWPVYCANFEEFVLLHYLYFRVYYCGDVCCSGEGLAEIWFFGFAVCCAECYYYVYRVSDLQPPKPRFR